MSDVQKRLQESTDTCLKSYESWNSNKKDSAIREQLLDSIHELRKTTSRLEIEIAMSDRGTNADNPIPIPPHRSSSKDKGAVESILPEDTDTGNRKESNGGARRSRGRKHSSKKSNKG